MVAVIAGVFTGCDAEYVIKGNNVYIADAALNPLRTTIVGLDPDIGYVDVVFFVRLAKRVDFDVTVAITLDDNYLSEFNTSYGTRHVTIPNEHIDLEADAKVTIPAREIGAAFTVRVTDFNFDGVRYVLPIALGEVTGEIEKLEAQSKFIYSFAKPVVTE